MHFARQLLPSLKLFACLRRCQPSGPVEHVEQEGGLQGPSDDSAHSSQRMSKDIGPCWATFWACALLPHGDTTRANRLIGWCQTICHDKLPCQAPVSAEAGTEFLHISSFSICFSMFFSMLSSIFHFSWQDDVASRARARELAVSLVNRARAQIGAGDPVKAEQARQPTSWDSHLGTTMPSWRLRGITEIPWDTLRCLQCFKSMEFNGFQWIQEVNGTCVMTPIQIIQHREARMPYKHRIWWLPKFDCSDLAPGWWETLSRWQTQDPSYGRAKTVLAEAYQKQGRKHPETPANMVWLTPQHLRADSENGHSWHLWNDPKYMNIRMERLLQRVKS